MTERAEGGREVGGQGEAPEAQGIVEEAGGVQEGEGGGGGDGRRRVFVAGGGVLVAPTFVALLVVFRGRQVGSPHGGRALKSREVESGETEERIRQPHSG